MQRVMSIQPEFMATPAGTGRSMGWPACHFMRAVPEGDCRPSSRMSWRRTRERLPPAESPAKTIWEAGIGAWGEPGGGERRER